ncbi:hypothetical protein PSN45_002458 [Yamadazyma tenuis]|uniref:Mitochondrial thiamine pyrophosphate carrier 1 n=1 Tax=Candida tenuis (strain ATCC 10573 / BCRC 21748 / CBS 615 / JCM 9827 / NBRC 10315 / NRRL Y-1498 / VKM Y-70) TaxID=590646 RepID=G3B0E2_CANTC|nr:mitochondrial carrier [Yamadazyma tenuis ATCC 10573]EGV65378.1 mitochondrial carrier [Yamadazyma tenuis ATCC 10573]WEJ94955.1 hypothetical protein PSN45_002458 [Yamadazyma tenuis]
MSTLLTTPTVPLGYPPQHYDTNFGSECIDMLAKDDNDNNKASESPIINCMIAGGLGGMVGDTSMHSLDTVKTRQQGFMQNLKYKNMIPAFTTILKEEGFFRGLYGGYSPAILGSLPSTAAFFGMYEYSKRTLIKDLRMNETLAYFLAGILGDLASSVFYVPSEVLKTRLQLQGRYNNPYTKGSGYNYKGLVDAVKTIHRVEGSRTFVFGYKETLFRDLPFSALQFAFYERFRQLAIFYNDSEDLSIGAELLSGASAGGLAGVLTTPLDVIKTRIQTATEASTSAVQMSTIKALRSIYHTEGVLGMFYGVGPRFIWTGIQSSIMLLLYQVSLKKIDSMLVSKGALE